MSERRNLQEMLTSTGISRRTLLQRGALLGLSVPFAGALLAACEIDEEDDDVDDIAVDDDDEPATGPDDDEPDVDDDAEADDETTDDGDRYGGRIRLMGHHSIDTLHPDDDGATVEWTAINCVHEPLIEIDHIYDFEYLLATDYEISDDGMTYTVTLREGVLFHDGEPFTSEDVKYTYDWFMDEDNAAITAAEFISVDSVDAPDDHTIVINMAEPDASMLRRAFTAMILPAHYHEEVGYEDYSGSPIGTGPFSLAEWEPDSHTLFEAFEDHWDGRPYVDEVEIRIVPEGSVRVLELETGGADSSIWMVGVDDALRLHNEADQLGIMSIETIRSTLNHFPINNTIPQFEDREVRQAIMHAIDRDQVIESVFAGAAVKATANIAPKIEEFYELDVKEYPYDPDQAIELLEEAGWVEGDDGIREKNGERLEWECLVITGDEARRPQAEMVAEYLSQVGMNMQISENPDTSGPMREGSADMALFNWGYGGGSGEPDGRVVLHSSGGNNFNHYSNPEMDELQEQGVQEADPEARREIYSEIQKLFAEDVPCIFFSHWEWYNQWNLRVQGLPEAEEVQWGHQLYRSGVLRNVWIEE
jgi:peptide/nickel transport system substrate-binding protein